MKANRLKWFLLFLLLIAASELPAQQSEADRKLLAEIRSKAEAGDAQYQYELGNIFFRGSLGVPKDEAEGVKWFRKSAEQRCAKAEFGLGCCYEMGQGVAKNEAEAVKWYRRAAEQGDADAQNNLGCCYGDGTGVTKDEAEAVKWLRKAAEQNNPKAQYNLGNQYAYGRGVAKDSAEAVKWFRKAAEQNHVSAQYNLGDCYADGSGVTKDDSEAVKWFRKAAEQNDAGAQYNLGSCYYRGRGVAKDYLKALNWFRKAAEQNLSPAQSVIGVCYANGQGVEKDAVEAVKWFRKAAEQGDASAQFCLGKSYYLGSGVVADYVEAYKWNALAAAQGVEDAVSAGVNVFGKELTPDQISEGQRRAGAFRPRVQASLDKNSGVDIVQWRPEFSGTGFFVTDDGYLITSEHVIGDRTEVRLISATGTLSAKVVKVDAADDVALLKTSGEFQALPVSTSRTVKMGGTVATVGFPNIGLQGFAPKLAKGEIAALSGAQDDPRYFQISVPVQPGNSGGALVDERGNVVGVVSAKLSAAAAVATSGALPENVNYAVKSSFLLSFLESVPEVSAKLKEPSTKECKFEDVVKSAERAAVLVLVY